MVKKNSFKKILQLPWYVHLLWVLLLVLLLNRTFKKLGSRFLLWVQTAKHDGSTVQNTTQGNQVNLQDAAQQIYNALTNFGYLFYGGLFTDGATVVSVLNSVGRSNITRLAQTYAGKFNRNMYTDIINGLTSSEYESVKNLLV